MGALGGTVDGVPGSVQTYREALTNAVVKVSLNTETTNLSFAGAGNFHMTCFAAQSDSFYVTEPGNTRRTTKLAIEHSPEPV